MKKNILKSLFVSVLCMLAASCQDTEFAEAVDSSKAQVMFSIAMDSPAARSRATWGENQDDENSAIGNDFDTHIDLDQFIIKIESGNITYNVKDIIKWKEGSESGYKFVGIVEGITSRTELTKPRIVAYVNMGKNTDSNAPYATFNKDTENIPMWGVLTPANKLTFEPGKRTTVSTISLLRAMAKIEVSLSTAMQNAYALTGVTLNKHNAQGYCLPNANEITRANTTEMNTDAVFNPLKAEEEQVSLPFEVATTNASYVIYLPEVAKEDGLSISVDLIAKDAEGNLSNETATGKFSLKNFTTNDAINVVRNHWYKYTINDFASNDINVKFEELSWDNHTVNINVGGEGFLALNKDVIEMFGTNIDAEQLKFSSSTPITIELADIYEHKRNGEIVEGTEDGVFAYYIDKYGIPTQLPAATDTDKEEYVILANTSAVVAGNDPSVLNGNIKITSPFMPDASATNNILKAGSHDNTIRYLEFKVTNEDNLQATFRVMQYPPVIITNKIGYCSFRSDFVTRQPKENGMPTNYLYWDDYHLTVSLFYAVHDHVHQKTHDDEDNHHGDEENEKWYYFNGVSDDEAYCWGHAFTDGYYWEELHYGSITYSTVHPVGPIWRYGEKWRKAMEGVGNYAPVLGPIFKGEDGNLYRKHYPGNAFAFFGSKYVDEEVQMNENNRGKAQIHWMNHNTSAKKYVPRSGFSFIGNPHIYQIKSTAISSTEYTLGYPILVDDENNITNDSEKGRTLESENNSKMVSPNFMIASELGNAEFPTDADYRYDQREAPIEDFIYEHAVKHCKKYVEVAYRDNNGSGKYEADFDEIVVYDDWRLPTLAEANIIFTYQEESRAMDRVMNGNKFVCARPDGYFTNLDPTITDRHMRCVRDVKSEDVYIKSITEKYPIKTNE